MLPAKRAATGPANNATNGCRPVQPPPAPAPAVAPNGFDFPKMPVEPGLGPLAKRPRHVACHVDNAHVASTPGSATQTASNMASQSKASATTFPPWQQGPATGLVPAELSAANGIGAIVVGGSLAGPEEVGGMAAHVEASLAPEVTEPKLE